MEIKKIGTPGTVILFPVWYNGTSLTRRRTFND